MKTLTKVALAAGLAGLLITTPVVVSKVQKEILLVELSESKESTVVENITTAQQLENIIKNNDYVAVDIGATWCGPCREYSPTFHKVAEEYKGKVVFCQVVLDQIDKKEERTISKDYKVRYIPKTMLFKKGKEVYSRAGDIEKEDLKSLLDEYLLDKKSDSKN